MADDRPQSGFLIGAQIRLAAREGIPITVRKRGDETFGAIILKINRLDGTAHVLAQSRMDDEIVWNPVSRTDPLPEDEAERYLARQGDIDPDSWILEVEDRQGRHWFPGKVIKL